MMYGVVVIRRQKVKRTTIYIDGELHEQARNFAYSQNLSVSQLVMIALKKLMDEAGY